MKKVLIELTVEVDGVCPDDTMEKAIMKRMDYTVIGSEDFDGTEDWALYLNKVEVRVVEETE
jgi:hypothetical protein